MPAAVEGDVVSNGETWGTDWLLANPDPSKAAEVMPPMPLPMTM